MERPLAFPDLMRTDLALEAREAVRARDGGDVDGVEVDVEEEDGMRITRMEIRTDAAADRLGKAKGRYTTLEAPRLREEDRTFLPRVVDRLASEMHRYFADFGIGPDDLVLVVGLGNRDVTPDALGPEVVARVHVTNHLFGAEGVDVSGFRPVAAVAPGVLGTTGIETGEIVAALARAVAPRAIVAVDALRAHRLDRLHTTVQLSDTGIVPGSGLGMKRRPLTREELGVPVLAVGIPTVVDAATIVADTLHVLERSIGRQLSWEADPPPRGRLVSPDALPGITSSPIRESKPTSEVRQAILGFLGELSDDERRSLFVEVLGPVEYNFIVTPKDIDAFIDRAATFLAAALNRALHPDVTADNYGVF
ncbi:GPR endopeptidase [Brockia lithotrophica]|uniref:Germination protease n=1 Tax=Brockia lithotrophica TaxID=933949 RepID=A0A660L4D0_9BACL|nr:GPR endopeptidase [Brockia lithotrophica]RKQ88891.1 GPR endopeptidase [Brockia lithotrophica]